MPFSQDYILKQLFKAKRSTTKGLIEYKNSLLEFCKLKPSRLSNLSDDEICDRVTECKSNDYDSFNDFKVCVLGAELPPPKAKLKP
jgi:hypothetical protein